MKLTVYRIEGWWFSTTRRAAAVIGRLHARGMKALVYFRPFFDRDERGQRPGGLRQARARRLGGEDRRPASRTCSSTTSTRQAALLDVTNPDARRWWEGRIRARSTSAPTASCRTSASRCRWTCASPTARRAPRCTTATRGSTTTRCARSSTATRRASRAAASSTRAPATAARRVGRVRERELPGRREHGLEPLVRARVAHHRHAQPRRRRRLRVQHRHRRLLRHRSVPADHEGAVPALGRSGRLSRRSSGCTGRSAPARTRRGRFDEETIGLYRAISGLHEQAGPYIARCGAGGADRRAARPGRCGWRSPATPRPRGRTSSGCSGRDVLVAPVVEEGATARDVYFPRGCWEAGETRRALHRAARGAGGRAADAAAVVLPLRHASRWPRPRGRAAATVSARCRA